MTSSTVGRAVADVAGWWWYVAKATARGLWDGLPGPWPVKVLLVVACTAIPGALDEIALLALVAWARRRKAR
jgi:hypothetical protein